jgi:DNA-binding NtrC family response regulator
MSPKQILVVDDDADMRNALQHVIHGWGFQVMCVGSAPLAVEQYTRHPYDLVITDLKMPQMSGVELLTRLQQDAPHIPVIMITAYGTVDRAVEAMRLGASDFILKPFSVDTLETKIKRVLARSPRVAASDPDDDRPRPHISAKEIITQDTALLKVLQMAKCVAPSDATVLILGENGTGKELLAAYIHRHSCKHAGPHVAINCASLPETLAESELFGHEKGAFTGAINRKIGKFELAHKGTLLLDEISELSLPLQAKLLRVLQERVIDRVGGNRAIGIDTRVIAISNVDLTEAVVQKRFREDLYYRLNVVPLKVPPLRERPEDVPLLADHFLKRFSLIYNRHMTQCDPEAMQMLQQWPWYGNVRELENVIERAVLIGAGDVLKTDWLNLEAPQRMPAERLAIIPGGTVKDMEKQLILQTLARCKDNRTQASKCLGISIRTLRNKLRVYRSEAD